MSRDFLLSFFFFSLPLFLLAAYSLSPRLSFLHRSCLAHVERRGMPRQTIFASFFLSRIKNEKGSWGKKGGGRIRGCKGRGGVENMHTWAIRGTTKRRDGIRGFIRVV